MKTRGVSLAELKRTARLTWPTATVTESVSGSERSFAGKWIVEVGVPVGMFTASAVIAVHDDRSVARYMALAACKEAIARVGQ